MVLATGESYDKGCIRDNGVIESSTLSARGYKTGGEKYEPRIGGGQTGEWQDTGYRSNGDAFLIDVSGKTYTTSLYGINKNDIKRCRICAKPKFREGWKFKLKSDNRPYISVDTRNDNNKKNDVEVVDNCLCTKILGVDGIKKDNLNDNPSLNHIDIRQYPAPISDLSYCQEYAERFKVESCKGSMQGYCKQNPNDQACIDNQSRLASHYSNIKSISNYSCTDQFYYDANNNDKYDGVSEDIVYNNLDLKYINLDYYKRDHSRKHPLYQSTCYYDAGMGAMIGLFGANGQDVPVETYMLYSEFYLKDTDSYRYKSPNNQIFPNHISGEKISLKYNDGYYDDNSGYYRINFIEGVMTKDFGYILSKIVQEVENLYVGDGYLKESFKRIVGNSIFQFLVKFALIFYLAFSALGIITGTVEISRKEFFTRILKIALILFFTNPGSWGWYNDIVVGFFMGSITTLNELTLNLDFATKDPLITIAEDKFGTSNGHAQKFAFPDQMIKAFFMSENIFIKLWSLLFSPFNLAGIFIIAGIYALMFYFLYIMAIVVLNYLTAVTIIVTLLAIGPIVFLFSINKLTITFFNRWLVYMSSRIIEITMLFLLLYVFLSAINDKIGLYQSLNPDSLLYFESCPYSLYDLMSWVADVTHLSDVDNFVNGHITNPISEGVKSFLKEVFSFFRVYVANPTNGIEDMDGNFIGGKDFFEMISIIMEAFILLYFMNVIMGQVGLSAAAMISYQQQNASIFSGARGIAKEGAIILESVQKNVSSGIKFARGEFANARSFAYRSASNIMKFSLEHDVFARRLNNLFGGRADNYAAGSLSSKIPSARSNFYDAKAEQNARRHINIFENNMQNIRDEVISDMGLEDKISKESVEKIKNNQIDKKTLDELNNINVKYNDLCQNIELKAKLSEKTEHDLRSSVTKTMLDKSDIAIREVNKYLTEQEIIKELNLLKEESEFLTAPQAYDRLSDKLSSKYDDINFSESLRQVLNKNLTDREILENANKIQTGIINRLISVEQDNNPNFNINNNKNYDELQKKLRKDEGYQLLQYHIQEHLSYNQNINRSARHFAKTTIPKAIKNKGKIAAVAAVVAVFTGLAVPLIASVAVGVAAKKVFNIRYLLPRAIYRGSKYSVNKNVSFRVHRSPSNNMMFDALNNTLYRVTFSPQYELYHLANSKENKELRFARKEAEKHKLFLREVSDADKYRLEKIIGKEFAEITIEDIQRNQEEIKKTSLKESMSMLYRSYRSKKLYQTKDENSDNYVQPLESNDSLKISVNDNGDKNEKINRLKTNLSNIKSSEKALTEAQNKIIEKIKLESGKNENDEQIREEISENYPHVKSLQTEYDKAKAKLEDTLYEYSMNKDKAITLLQEELNSYNDSELEAKKQELRELYERKSSFGETFDIDDFTDCQLQINNLEKNINDARIVELESRKKSLAGYIKQLEDADIK